MTLDQRRLWAKSKKDYEPFIVSMLLPQHLMDAHTAAERVLMSTGADQLAALALPADAYGDRLRRIVLLAAAVHDLGKANDHFQSMITGKRNVQQNPQGLRHEWVTILMLAHLRGWLLPAVAGSEVDFAIVEWAVSGHHPAHDHPSPPRLCPPGAGTEIKLLIGHADLAQALQDLQTTFKLQQPPRLADEPRNLVGTHNVFDELARYHRAAQQRWEKLKKTPDRLLVAAARNCLIAADVASSALPRRVSDDEERWGQIDKAFGNKPKAGDVQFIVDWRLERERRKGKPAALRGFQRQMADSKELVTYVKAACGTGKTMGAYQWAASQHPGRRLYFCYPTTGTATEGFKDYLFPMEVHPEENDPHVTRLREIEAKLFHSRADVDFEIILTTGQDTPAEERDAAARLDALEAWSTPIVACTVDTVLGIVQNNRRGLLGWPALAQAAFVFDEIHAYDDRLFGALLRFLRDVPGLPVLLMTASLPSAREEALKAALAKRRIAWKPIPGPAELEQLPRYHKEACADNEPLSRIAETLANDRKVLWVCNTVGRVMDGAARVARLSPLIYHSRFKYVDRVERHKAVIEAFDPEKNARAALAICSQVAEMSLDLSADLLVTDLATVPAIIQRLGRLNRRAKPGQTTKPFVVIEPDNHLPYTPAELDAARQWLDRLPADEITQKHLADLWEQAGDQPPELVPSAWLDGGPTTTVTELREASPGITVLMEEDLSNVRASSKNLVRYLLPMPPPPRRLNWKAWPRERGLPVAPERTILYDRMRGAEWAK